MKRIIIAAMALLFLNLPAVDCFGAVESGGSVTGKVVDDYSNAPIPAAHVELRNPSDGTLIASAECRDNGRFSLDRVPYGHYALCISYDGYLETVIDDVEVSRSNHKVKLKTLKLVENVVMLDEVTVTQGRLKGEEKIDKTVFTINDDIRRASSSGLDMLRHIPSVTVDLMKNVTLEGRSDIHFYVDGVKRSKEFVSQLDPEMIDRVELITNPSAKYDSDISGVISIMLKNRQRAGVSGSIDLSLPHPDKVVAEPSANIEYGSDKFRLFAGDRADIQKFDSTGSNLNRWQDTSGNSVRFEKNASGTLMSRYNYLNYGVDWFLNSDTALNFMGEWKTWKYSRGNETAVNRLYTEDILQQYYETHLDSDVYSDDYSFSLFFRKALEQDGFEFTAELYFNRGIDETDQQYTDTFYDVEDPDSVVGTVLKSEMIDNTRDTARLKLDHGFLLMGVKNEIGLRSTVIRSENDFHSRSSLSDGEHVENFAYDEWRQAAYYTALGEAGGIKWQLGVTGEYTAIDFDDADSSSYTNILPQASLQRAFEKAGELKLSFERKIKRPQPNQLNPFEVILDSMRVRQGNRDLDPELINRSELAWSKNFGDNFISPKLYYEYTDNAIQDVTTIGDDGISRTIPDNIGKNSEYGIEFTASLQVTSRWRLGGNIAAFNCEIDSKLSSGADEKQEKSGYRLNASNIITLPRDYTLNAVVQYNSPYITYQREHHRDLLAFFGISKKFSDRAELSLFYVPFIKDFTYSKTITDYPGYYEKTEGSVDVENLFVIGFTYRFNRGKDINKIERTVESETSQAGGAF